MTHQRGFSLLEALIALIVLAIGLLGVAAMQLKALQSANTAYQRSVASVAAVDAQERLWAELAKLEADKTCENIDTSTVQSAWENRWFDYKSPLRNANESGSSIERDSGEDICQFDVVLELSNEENDQLGYTFRLPRLEVQE